MLIYVLILAFFVSLALMATTILIGFVGFTMPIPPAGLVVIGVLTGCLSALLHLLRDIIDMTLFIGEPKGSDVSRLVYAFVPPITVPVLASIIATI